jgi:hypothetical protein
MDTEIVEKVWGAITDELDAKAESGIPLTEVSLETVEDDHAVILDADEGDLYRVDYIQKDDGSVELGDWQPIQDAVVKQYIVPLEKADDGAEQKRITYGVVLEPDIEDLQGDIVSADDIEKAAHDWMANSRAAGLMHKDLIPGAKVVESYTAPADLDFETPTGVERVKKGSWVLAMQWPTSIWKRITSGELTGYSVGGSGVRRDIEADGVAKALAATIAEMVDDDELVDGETGIERIRKATGHNWTLNSIEFWAEQFGPDSLHRKLVAEGMTDGDATATLEALEVGDG